MGLAPKVTSMGKMNVSANFGGDKLKTVIYQIDEVQNLMIYLKIIQFKGLIFRHEVDFSLMGLTHYLS